MAEPFEDITALPTEESPILTETQVRAIVDDSLLNSNFALRTRNGIRRLNDLVTEDLLDDIFGIFEGRSTDGLTETVFNSTITRDPVTTRMVRTGSSPTWKLASTGLGARGKGSTSDFNWDNSYQFFCRVSSSEGVESGAEGTGFFWGLLDGTENIDLQGDTVLTTRHAGFLLGDSNDLYASNADGTTQNKTLLNLPDVTAENNYEIIYRPDEIIEFSVNGETLATHIGNIPSGDTNPPDIHFEGRSSLSSGEDVNFLLYNYYRLKVS